MSRGISVANAAEVDAPHREAVVLASLAFDTPIYVHTRIGPIVFGGNTYVGVGDFGGVESVEETEVVAPGPFRLVLSGVDSTYISEAMDAGNYGDIVTVYLGFVDDTGSLVSDPEILGRGEFEFAAIEIGEDESRIVVVVQHELAALNTSNGSRWTDEDQQRRFPGDTFFSFSADSVEKTLSWAGGPVSRTVVSDGDQDDRRNSDGFQ